MKNQNAFSLLSATVVFFGLFESAAIAQDTEGDIDAYFLSSGELSASEQSQFEERVAVEAQMMKGESAEIPRGLLGGRAPTFRFVHWTGEVGDSEGRFVSPLSVRPALPSASAYQFNAQILGFHGAKEDWGKRKNRGTMTIELRGRVGGEPVTWLYAQQFDVDDRGFTNIGFEYVAQREGAPEPAVTTEPNLGLRIQLMRSPSSGGKILRKLMKTALAVSGVPVQLNDPDLQNALSALPPIRIPAMLQEGVALSQAVIGTTAEEVPIWRGGFSSYGLAKEGSRLALSPGYWMAIDSSRETDLTGVVLSDVGGLVAPTRDGEVLDANFLVLAVELSEGSVPPFLDYTHRQQVQPVSQPEPQLLLTEPLPATPPSQDAAPMPRSENFFDRLPPMNDDLEAEEGEPNE